MGFTVPEPYAWDDSFRVCYDNLDGEHKLIFDAIFACSKAPGDAGKLAGLVKVTKDHFATEEGMMKKANYATFPEHKGKHDDFVAKISALSTPLEGASIDFAKQWLVDHIMGTDFNYKGKL